MKTLIVSDIFGKTKHLSELARAISSDYEIFAPYSGEEIAFSSEKSAYVYFMSNVGLDNYTNTLKKYVASFSKPVCLVGFSIGASAIWKLSGDVYIKNICEATCF